VPKERTFGVAAPEVTAQQLARDDLEAWQGLSALRPALVAVARHVLGFGASGAEVDDCVAEVFRRAFEGRDRASATIPLARSDDLTLLEGIADEAPGAHHHLEVAERARRLQAALSALPHEQRRAILMHAEGHSYREIGESMSVPIGTVCTWISRARSGLESALRHGELEEQT
jgi:DNA-directed RNA polymerase specialized sigma24 family protein